MKRVEEGAAITTARFAGLFFLLWIAWIDGAIRRPSSIAERARWNQGWCRRTLRYLRVNIHVGGVVPLRGLIVANHISYVDVLVLGALTPTIFVSKAEVRRWPLIGTLCARSGTIFLRRESSRDVAEVNRKIAEALRQNVPVVVFPEGTTTEGERLLPLHSALLHPALQCGAPIVPAAIAYGDASKNSLVKGRIPYCGDATLAPHLRGVCALRSIDVTVSFRTTGVPALHRGQAASMCEVAIQHMLDRISGRVQQATAA